MSKYKDREAAALCLAEALESLHSKRDMIVLGLPRGGAVIAHTVARYLDLDWDLLNARKIGHPQNPEVAIGAVAEMGIVILDDAMLSAKNIAPVVLQDRINLQQDLLERRIGLYRSYERLELSDKAVLIVDDGIATGWTMMAAVQSANIQGAAEVIAAAPVGAYESIADLRDVAAEVIVPLIPDPFYAVGSHYRSFDQVSDDQVIELLSKRD